MSRVVITTWGSLGDFYPYLLIGIELKRRGHNVVLATCPVYQERTERAGLAFSPIRPDFADPDLIRRGMAPRRGTKFLIRDYWMPHLRLSFEDLKAVVEAEGGADLLLSFVGPMAAPLVAEATGVRWVSSVLSPVSYLSSHDPLVTSAMPFLAHAHRLGPWATASLIRLIKRLTRRWGRPMEALRNELGLLDKRHPLLERLHSPRRVLGLFSSVLAPSRPDWPPQALTTGFISPSPASPGSSLSPALEAFLKAGRPPLVFTLGASTAYRANRFYKESIEAARRLGERAVLLVGKDAYLETLPPLPEGIAAFGYVPYADIFPHASAIVHPGGIGTIALALQAGRPMVLAPLAHDQPDNAARTARLGAARVVSMRRYRAARIAAALEALLAEDSYARAAREAARHLAAENGLRTACDVIEDELQQAVDRRSTNGTVRSQAIDQLL